MMPMMVVGLLLFPSNQMAEHLQLKKRNHSSLTRRVQQSHWPEHFPVHAISTEAKTKQRMD